MKTESSVNDGLVLIDKPCGCTSHDVVNQWRKLACTRRVGHLGTLDPMATGLLVLVSGMATRLASYFVKDEKTYRAEITLGLTSDTYDAEGEVTSTGVNMPEIAAIADALSRFSGHFDQMPPPVSAKKVNGVPAYKLSRQKIDFQLQPVRVEVKSISWRLASASVLQLELTCSAGTYIRSIAHDLGSALGCGAILSQLRRTRVADLAVDQARSIDQLRALTLAGNLNEAVIPMGRLLPDLPVEYVSEEVERGIRQGRDFRTSPFVVPPGAPLVRALSRSGDLIAMGELRFPNVYHPSTVF